MTMPLYIQAVQSAVSRIPRVVTSNIQFSATSEHHCDAIFGSILASRLDRTSRHRSALNLPASFHKLQGCSGSAQQIFDPAHLAAARAAFRRPRQPLFDQCDPRVKAGLHDAVRNLFLIGTVDPVSWASLFMPNVPLLARRSGGRRARRGLTSSRSETEDDEGARELEPQGS